MVINHREAEESVGEFFVPRVRFLKVQARLLITYIVSPCVGGDGMALDPYGLSASHAFSSYIWFMVPHGLKCAARTLVSKFQTESSVDICFFDERKDIQNNIITYGGAALKPHECWNSREKGGRGDVT